MKPASATRRMTACGSGGFGGVPLVDHGVGDAAELDDGEFADELALEGADAAADVGHGGAEFGRGHGDTSGWVVRIGIFGPRIKYGVTLLGDLQDFWEYPLISGHFR